MCEDTEAENRYKENLALYRNQLSDQQCAAERDLDNMITLVATGALVVSIGLLDHFTSIFEIWTIGFAWTCLLATLVAHALSFWFSKRVFKRQIDLIDECKLESGYNVWRKWLRISNYASRVCLILGIAGLLVYAYGKLEVTSNVIGNQNGGECEHNEKAGQTPYAPTQTSKT